MAAIRGVNLSSIPCCLAGNKVDLTDLVQVSEGKKIFFFVS